MKINKKFIISMRTHKDKNSNQNANQTLMIIEIKDPNKIFP